MVGKQSNQNLESLYHRRQAELLRRGLPADFKYNITFLGNGGVVEQALTSIIHAATAQQFIIPLGKLRVVGKDTHASLSRRKKLVEQSRQVAKQYISHISTHTTHELTDILKDTDVFFFAAANHNPQETDRSRLIDSNIEVVNDIAEHFNNKPEKYKGIINFISNLPEALAHYAANKWDLHDIRQITAHIPLESIRYEHYLRHYLLSGYKGAIFDLLTSGYHDNPYMCINGAKLIHSRTIEMNTKGELMPKLVVEDISQLIRKKGKDEAALSKAVINYVPREAKWHVESGKGKDQGPTTTPTGEAVKDLLLAIINRTETITGIPHQFNGEWYFTQMPTTFQNGFAQLDPFRYEQLADEDREAIQERITGQAIKEDKQKGWQALKEKAGKILGAKKPQPSKSLREQLQSSRYANMLTLLAPPSDTATIQALFNPAEKNIIITNPIVYDINENPDIKKKILTTAKNLEELKTQVKSQETKLSRIIKSVQTTDPSMLREKLCTSLNTTIFFDNKQKEEGNLIITEYNFKQSPLPQINKEYELDLQGLVQPHELSRDKQKLEVLLKAQNNKHLYVLAKRPRNSEENDYRLFVFRRATGKLANYKEFRKDKNELSIETMHIEEETLYLAGMLHGQPGIFSWKQEHDGLEWIRKTKEEPQMLFGAAPFLYLTNTGIYRDDENITSLKKRWNGYAQFLQSYDLLGCSTDHTFEIVDVQTKKKKTFPSTNYRHALVGNEQGIQLLLGRKDGVEVIRYDSKQSIFADKTPQPSQIITDKHLDTLNCIYTDSPNIFFAETEQDIVAVYHDGNNQYCETVNINNFKPFGGMI